MCYIPTEVFSEKNVDFQMVTIRMDPMTQMDKWDLTEYIGTEKL